MHRTRAPDSDQRRAPQLLAICAPDEKPATNCRMRSLRLQTSSRRLHALFLRSSLTIEPFSPTQKHPLFVQSRHVVCCKNVCTFSDQSHRCYQSFERKTDCNANSPSANRTSERTVRQRSTSELLCDRRMGREGRERERRAASSPRSMFV